MNLLEISPKFLLTETPENYVAWDLIPDHVRGSKNGTELDAIAKEIERTILGYKKSVEEFSASDWIEAKERVNELVKSYEK